MAEKIDVKNLAIKHGDKVLLVVVFIFVVVHFLGNLGDSEAADKGDELDELLGRIEENRDNSRPPELPKPASLDEVEIALDPDRAPEVDPLPGWSMYRRIPVLRKVDKAAPVTRRIPMHSAPAGLQVDPQMGQMVITWEPAASSANRFVSVGYYKVYRRVGDGAFETIAEIPVDKDVELYHVDADVQVGLKYWYKVSSVVTVDADAEPLPDEELEKATDPVGPIEPPSDVVIHVLRVEDPTEEQRILDTIGRAYLKVFKWDQDAREWREFRPFWVEEGQAIEIKEVFGNTENIIETGFRLDRVRIYERDKKLGETTIQEDVQEIVVIDSQDNERILIDKDKAALPSAGQGRPGRGGASGGDKTGARGKDGGKAAEGEPEEESSEPDDERTRRRKRRGGGFFGK